MTGIHLVALQCLTSKKCTNILLNMKRKSLTEKPLLDKTKTAKWDNVRNIQAILWDIFYFEKGQSDKNFAIFTFSVYQQSLC